MRHQIKKILEKILRFLATAILDKYKPKIIAITGSVGKTSTKEATYTVLAQSFKVRRNLKNYNNEIGIPLTIIGSSSGNKSVFKWLGIFIKALILIWGQAKNYPEILILEMGADHPGDIKYLTSFVPVDIGVITTVAPVHLEFFKTLEQIAKEKGELVWNLTKEGVAVLNYDDSLVRPMAEKVKGQVLTYGFAPQADFYGSEIAVSYKDTTTIQGISFKLNYGGSTVPILLPQVLGRHLVYTALAAIVVGQILKINLHTIIDRLKSFEPPNGRMHLLPGIKNTLIIDDTYNSSPLAVREALYQLGQINSNQHKKFAVLGDMLELGSYTEQAHQEIGEAVVDYGIDYLITVGELSRDTVRGAVKKGMDKDKCFNFSTSPEAGKFVQQKIEAEDIILVKGSQGIRMEKVVKEIMAEPQKAKELLVRQDKGWV